MCNSGFSRYREELILDGALCGAELVPGVSWIDTSKGLGLSSGGYPGRRMPVALRMVLRSAGQNSSSFYCLNDCKSHVSDWSGP